MYKTFNMGAGFAVYVSKKWASRVCKIAQEHCVAAFVAGYVEKDPRKYVYIQPKSITFDSEDLKVR